MTITPAIVRTAAFRDALQKAAQSLSASDILMARSGVNPAVVQGFGGLASMLLGVTKPPRYSFSDPRSVWHAMSQRGRNF